MWSSKRQPIVSRSTTEAKYKALSDGAQEGVYLKRLIEEITQSQIKSISIKCKDPQIIQDLATTHIPT